MREIMLVANVVFKESIRHRIITSLIFLSFIIIFASNLLNPIALGESSRLVKDAGLSTISFFSLLIILLSGTRLIYQEVEKKTIFIIITKPISRRKLLIGKFFGLISIIYFYSIISAVFFLLILLFAKMSFNITIIYSIILIMLQSTLLSAIAIFFSSFSSPILSGIFALMAYIAGYFISDISFFIEKSSSVLVKVFIKLLILVIPNFYYLDIKINAVNNLPVSINYMFFSASYTIIYIILLLYVSSVIFEKREFY